MAIQYTAVFERATSGTDMAKVIVLLMVVICTLTGCGKKGRLYLPDEQPAAALAAPDSLVRFA